MSQDCLDCIKVKHIEENMGKIEIKLNELTEKVVNMDKQSAVDSEKMDNFNKTVESIQQGITNIITKVDILEKKPLGKLDKIYAAVVGGVLVFIITKLLENYI